MKKNGKVRLCIDPKPLNQALKCNYYSRPTIEDVLSDLSKANVFRVLDAKIGFLHVSLDEASSFAITFGSPWGRHRWLKMPFGISPAPEEFQRRIDQAPAGLDGCKSIADDIIVFGCGETVEEATADHGEKLRSLVQRCRERGVKLNCAKLQLRRKEVSYMGHVLSADGLKADPEKVKAIKDIPAPKDKQSVLCLLPSASYLQKFAPNFSEVTSPLRDPTKSDTEFVWDK